MKFRAVLAALFVIMTLAACENQDEKHARYIQRGNTLFEQGDYVRARLEYKNAARIKPSDAQVRYRLGLVDEAQGDVRAAFGNFLASEQQDGRYVPALLKLVQYFLAGDNVPEAQKRIETAAAVAPDNPDVHALTGAVHLRQKSFAQAEFEERAALKIDPSNVTAYTVLTGLYVAQQEMDKAFATVEEAVGKNPKSLALLLLKGMVYEKAGRVDKIVEAYQTIFALRPVEPRYRSDLAQALVQADRTDEAEKVLRDGVAAMPDNWGMRKTLVMFLSEKRGLESAEAEVKAAMATHPEKEELSFWLAELYMVHKASDRAIALLQTLVDTAGSDDRRANSLSARASLARIYFIKGDKRLAEQLAETILAKEPNHKEALLIKAQRLFEQGAYQEAVTLLRTVVRDHPKTPEALQLLGETLLLQGYVDLAVDTFAQLVEAAPVNIPAKVRLAQLYALAGDSKKADELLELVIKLEPDYSVAWETLARTAIDGKKWPDAIKAIERLEKIKDQERVAHFLRGQVALGRGEAQEEAVAEFKKAVADDPAAPIAEHALRALVGWAALSGKAQAQDVAGYISGLSQTPFTLTLLGDCQMIAGNRAAALEAYEKAIAAKATAPEPYIARARFYAAAKEMGKAIDLLRLAEDVAPGDFRIALMRADFLGFAGRYDEALAVYDAILARQPNMDVAANNEAQMLADHRANDSKALEKARVLAERFIRSPNPYFLDTLGWVYVRQGNLKQAQTIFERIMGMQKELPPQIHYHYGTLLARVGRKAEAVEELLKALEGQSAYEGREQAETLLKDLKKN